MQERDKSNTTSKTTEHQVTKTSHRSRICPSPHCRGMKLEDGQRTWGWRKPHYRAGVSISHPPMPLTTTHVSQRKHPTEAICPLLPILPCEGSKQALPPPTNSGAKKFLVFCIMTQKSFQADWPHWREMAGSKSPFSVSADWDKD